MAETILKTVKTLLGLDDESDAFDDEIKLHINGVFLTLKQLNVGPTTGYFLSTGDETWEEFFGTDPVIELVKNYVYLKVRLVFDPPSSSFVLDAYTKQSTEMEFRILVEADKLTL